MKVVLLGLAGILPPLVLGWMVGEDAPAVSACATGAATLWVLLATPALARRTSTAGTPHSGIQQISSL